MSTTVTVTIRNGVSADSVVRRRASIVLTVLFVAWVLGWLWWLTAAVAVSCVAWWAYNQHRAAAAEHAAIAARADQQHAWVLAGDPRGTYGVSNSDSS